jgi:predicted PurR-regulated permease PerM
MEPQGAEHGRQAMSRIHPAWFWIGVIVVFLLSLYLFGPILLPFVVGMLLAYLLNPPVTRLSRMGLGRTWASLLVLILAFIVFVGVLLLILPILQQQIGDLISRLPDLVALVREKLSTLLAFAQSRVSPETAVKIQESVGGVAGDLAGELAKFFAGMAAGIWTRGFALINILSLVFITPLVAFYLLNDWEKIVTTVDSYIPRRHLPTVRNLAKDIDAHLAGYVRGITMICVILALFYGTSLTLVGLDFGLIVGLFAGLMSFVPFVGALLGFLISVGLALLQFSEVSSVLLVAAIFIIGQIVEGNVLQPWLVGRQVNLHPVWIIFALLAGGTLFGFLGVLLGVPIAVVVSVLIRFMLRRYRESPLYNGNGTALPGPAPTDTGPSVP